MKKYIYYLLTLALLIPAFVSCTEQLEDLRSKNQKTHTVYFSTTDRATKTGLTIEGNMVKPDWRKTDLENIHFFEIDANNAAAPGTADAINLSDDNRTAHFTAAISDDITIIVSPSDGDNGSKGAKSAGVSPFTFAAVVAQQPDKKAYTYVIPSEQHPDAETLKDPNAEFLVGYSRKSYPDRYSYDDNVVVDLYFDRVAALGRLAISGFVETGEKVKSVTITADGGMTGKATYPGDFTLGDKNKVNFTKVDEPLVLDYGKNGVDAPASGAFYAYFVAVPGETSITSIEVLTDKYKYTKTVDGGVSFTFSDEQLLNIDFALSEEIAEAVTTDNNTWYKASMLESGYNYIIVSNGYALKNNGSKAVVAAQAVEIVDGTISLEETDGLIWTANANSEFTEYGTHTLSNGTEHLWRHSDNGTFTLEANNEAVTKYMVWNYDGEYLWNISIYNTTVSEYYAYYSSGWKISTTKTAATLFTNRPPIEISFASAEAKYDLDNEEWTVAIPELTAPQGATIAYSSSNEDIATVAADGTVTPKAAGNVRITATVAGDDEHQGGSAYYELAVTTSKITTWYKADELVAGEVYMIVSNANALRLDGTSLAAVANSAFTGDSFQYEADDNLKWTATASSGKFTFKSGSRLLSRSSGNISTSSSSGAAWSYDSAQNHIITTGNSGDYYMYFDGSAWKATTTAASTTTAAVYTMTPQLASRNLNFSAETVTHDLADGEDVNEPELTGDSLEGVTYASENEQIATVEANTGAVTLTGKTGSVKITASAQKTDTYKEESVSYTLIVKNGALGPKTYRKVTAASDLVVGARYILVYESGSLVFMPILETSGTSFSKSNNSLSVEISSNSITSAELGDYELALSEGYYLFVESANRYLYPYTADSGRTTAINAEESPEHALTITISGGNTKIDNGGNYLNYSTNNGGRFSSTASSTLNVSFFKLDDSTTPPTPEKQERNLSFGTGNFSCTLGQSATFPTLSGVTDGVTYSSSNESVATVNASGVVTAKAAGTTIIKAEAPESDTYLAGSAQYTLTVSAAPEPGNDKVYKKVTSQNELVADGTYLIVYENGADSKVFKPIRNGSSFTTSTANAEAVTISNNTITTSALDDHTVVFRNAEGNKFAMWVSGAECYLILRNDTASFVADDTNNGYRATFTVDNGNVTIVRNSYYLRYSASNEYFQVSTTSSNSAVALYKLDDGSSPGGGDDPGNDPTPTTNTYTRISGDANLVTGTYLIVNKTDEYLFNASGSNNGGYSNISSTTGITKDGSTITLTSEIAAASEFVITRSGNNLTIKQVGGSHAGQYMYATGNTSSTYIGFQESSADFVINAQNGDLVYFSTTKSSSSPTEYLYKKSSDSFFKLGGSGSPGGSDAGVYLYKKVENP